MGILRSVWVLRNVLIIVLTPLLLSPLLASGSSEAAAGFSLILMAVYWATEAFPIAVTALIPVMLFPMTGLMTGKEVSRQYISDSSMLFVGGLIMAVAIENWNIHKRIALRLLLFIGTQPTRLMFGMMLPSWFLSMWCSNMATTAMMCPIADALLKELAGSQGDTDTTVETEGKSEKGGTLGEYEIPAKGMDIEIKVSGSSSRNYGAIMADNYIVGGKRNPRSKSTAFRETVAETGSGEEGEAEKSPDVSRTREHQQLAKAMTISIAYAANIGGTTTITGCASNIILKGQADELFNARGLNSGITFGSWLVLGFPVSFLIFIILFIWLQLFFRGCRLSDQTNALNSSKVRDYIKREYKALGKMHFPEITVIVLFVVLVFLWVSRDLGGAGGWGNLFKTKYVTDSAAPTLVTLLLFLIPSNLPQFFRRSGRPTMAPTLLTWKAVHDKMPWGLFLLFGGGFALAEGCKVSGLSNSIRDALTEFRDLPTWVTCFLVAFLVSLVTEVATNTATCTLVLPIIAQLAISIDVNPLYLMIPTAVATSYAYMLPVATPPNAMVYVLGYFSTSEMVRAGFVMNLMSVVILTLGVNTWGSQYFGLDQPLPRAEGFVNVTSASYVNATPCSVF